MSDWWDYDQIISFGEPADLLHTRDGRWGVYTGYERESFFGHYVVHTVDGEIIKSELRDFLANQQAQIDNFLDSDEGDLDPDYIVERALDKVGENFYGDDITFVTQCRYSSHDHFKDEI